MKYIDAEKLIAEIEKQKYEVFPTNDGKVRACSTPDQLQSGWLNALTWMLKLIASLQQEQSEVDLEEEIGHWMDKLDDKYCTRVEDYSVQDIKDTARYFHELGLNARKEVDLEKEIYDYMKKHHLQMLDGGRIVFENGDTPNFMCDFRDFAGHFFELGKNARKEELPEIELNKFANKVNTFKARYKHPESISINGAMAFMARMFYQYPNAARQWYDSLPKATMD